MPGAATMWARIDAEPGPEACTIEVVPVVTASLPNRRRAAKRHQAPFGCHHPDSGLTASADLRAFGGRRLAAAEAGQRLDEYPMLGEDHRPWRPPGWRRHAQEAGRDPHAGAPQEGCPCRPWVGDGPGCSAPLPGRADGRRARPAASYQPRAAGLPLRSGAPDACRKPKPSASSVNCISRLSG
jgi:hypothetical protein